MVGAKTDWQMVWEKEWRPKKIPRSVSFDKSKPTPDGNHKLLFFFDRKRWSDSVAFFKDKGFFLKCFGDLPTFCHVKRWCEETWPFKVEIMTMPNGYFLVITKNNKYKNWVLQNGPFF